MASPLSVDANASKARKQGFSPRRREGTKTAFMSIRAVCERMPAKHKNFYLFVSSCLRGENPCLLICNARPQTIGPTLQRKVKPKATARILVRSATAPPTPAQHQTPETMERPSFPTPATKHSAISMGQRLTILRQCQPFRQQLR